MPSTLIGAYGVAEGDVWLRVEIGNGQAGWTSLTMGSELAAEGKEVDVMLGRGLDLVGRVLICTTNIRDVQPATNHASVTYFFSGGRQPKMWQLNEQLDENAVMQCHAIFTFSD